MSSRTTFHEKLDRVEAVPSASNRSTGVVLTIVLGVIGLYPLIDGGAPRIWALGAGGALLVVALVLPRLLGPLNALWMWLGRTLQKVASPIVMGVVYYLAVAPIGVIRRLFGWDPLHRSFDPEAESYWIERTPPGPAPDTMNRQF